MSERIAAAAMAPKDIPTISGDESFVCAVGFEVLLGVAVAVVGEVDDDDGTEEAEEDVDAVVVGKIKMDDGIALLDIVVSDVGDPDAVKSEVVLLEVSVIVVLLETAVLEELGREEARMIDVEGVKTAFEVEALGVGIIGATDVLSELIAETLLEPSIGADSDAADAAR
jgi:hypothetical protein